MDPKYSIALTIPRRILPIDGIVIEPRRNIRDQLVPPPPPHALIPHMLQISATSSYCHESLMANRTTSHMGYACTYQCSTPSSATPDAYMASPKSDGGCIYQEGKAKMFSGATHRSIHGYRREEREKEGRDRDIFVEHGRAWSDEYKDCLHLTCSSGLENSPHPHQPLRISSSVSLRFTS